MLRRLEVGLVDEGVSVVRALPAGSMCEPTTGLLAQVTYDDARWRLASLRRARMIERALIAVEPVPRGRDDPPIDLIHAWGEGCWTLAAELAADLGAGVAFEVWSSSCLSRLSQFESRWASRFEAAEAVALWLAPDHAMESAVLRVPRAWASRRSDWGVHVPNEPRPRPTVESAKGITILSGAEAPGLLADALAGFAEAARSREDLLAFLPAECVARRPQLWAHAESLGMTGRLSLIPDIEARRDLVLQTDMLLLPDRAGEHRTLALEAMACAIPVVARHDPLIEASSRARILGEEQPPGAHAWSNAITEILDDPAGAHDRALAARNYIRTSRLAHRQVAATLSAYGTLVQNPLTLPSNGTA